MASTDSDMRTSDVFAVIVAYHPDQIILRNINAVLPQVAHLLIVDNSESCDSLKKIIPASNSITYHRDGSNKGIARSLNIAVEYAGAAQAKWLLTLDQDTVLDPSYVLNLLEFLRHRADKEKVASIGGIFEDTFDTGSESIVKYLITSGNLIRLDAIQEVRGFRDDFFIDCVDYDISFRLRKAGYRIVVNKDQKFHHNLGSPSKHRILGATYTCSNHSALRRYYITRNRWIFFWENIYFDPKFVLRDAIHTLSEIVKLILSEPDRIRKLRAVGCGLRDGILRRMGKYPGSF